MIFVIPIYTSRKETSYLYNVTKSAKDIFFLFHLSVVTPSQYCHNDSICFGRSGADLTDFTLNTNIQTSDGWLVGPFTAHRGEAEGYWRLDLNHLTRTMKFSMDILRIFCRQYFTKHSIEKFN